MHVSKIFSFALFASFFAVTLVSDFAEARRGREHSSGGRSSYSSRSSYSTIRSNGRGSERITYTGAVILAQPDGYYSFGDENQCPFGCAIDQ